MCVLLIIRLLRLVARFNLTSWMTVVTPPDRSKLARNRCVIEVCDGVLSIDFFFYFLMVQYI